MRIGIDALALPQHSAGASRYLTNLVRHLARTDSDNDYFLFLKARDLPSFAGLPANFRTVVVNNYPRPARLLWQRVRSAHYVRQLDLDLWHAPHYVVPQGLDRCRLVVTFHDMTFFLFPEFYSPLKRFVFRTSIRQAVRSADAIISVSKTTQRDLIRCFPSAAGRAVAIHSGIDEAFFHPRRNGESKDGAYTAAAPYILFVGTLERRKNVPTLVAAFAELIHRSGLPHHLVLVGQAENNLQGVRRAIAEHRVGSRVHLPGYVSEADLLDLYAGAALFVCPSYYEGFSFPVLEAMASGVPALCSDAGASAEVGDHPLRLFRPDDVGALAERMHRALTDDALRCTLIDHGLHRAAAFRWDATALATRQVYETVGSASCSGRRSDPELGRDRDSGGRLRTFSPALKSTGIEQAVVRTLAFADLFDYPLTLEELHRGLIRERASLEDVQRAVYNSELAGRVALRDGFCFLRGRDHLVHLRRKRQKKARDLLRRHRHLLTWLCHFPFVRGVALSGALAFENANGHDDIDLFLLVEGRRVWSTYFCLALLLKIIGKRKMLCINYVEGRDDPTVPEQNFFVAHQIANLRPLFANGEFDRFWHANAWVTQYLPQADLPLPASVEALGFSSGPASLKRIGEKVTNGRLVDRFEAWVYRHYSERIQRLTYPTPDGVEVERRRIKLFTNDHLPTIMDRYRKRIQELESAPMEETGRCTVSATAEVGLP